MPSYLDPCVLLAPSQAVPVLPVAGGMMPPIPAIPIHSHHHQREQHHHHQEEQQQPHYHQYNRPSQPSSLQRSPSTAARALGAALTTHPSRAATAPRAAEAASAPNIDADVAPPQVARAVPLASPAPTVPGLPVLPGVPGSKICRVCSALPHDWPEECGRDGVTAHYPLNFCSEGLCPVVQWTLCVGVFFSCLFFKKKMKFSNTLPVVFILQGRNRLYLLSSNRPSSTSKQSFWYVCDSCFF